MNDYSLLSRLGRSPSRRFSTVRNRPRLAIRRRYSLSIKDVENRVTHARWACQRLLRDEIRACIFGFHNWEGCTPQVRKSSRPRARLEPKTRRLRGVLEM